MYSLSTSPRARSQSAPRRAYSPVSTAQFLALFALFLGLVAADATAAPSGGPPAGAPSQPIPGVYYNPYCINGTFPNGKKCNAYGPQAKRDIPYGVDSGGRQNKKGGLYKGGSPTKGMKTGGWRRSKSKGKKGGRHSGGPRRRGRH